MGKKRGYGSFVSGVAAGIELGDRVKNSQKSRELQEQRIAEGNELAAERARLRELEQARRNDLQQGFGFGGLDAPAEAAAPPAAPPEAMDAPAGPGVEVTPVRMPGGMPAPAREEAPAMAPQSAAPQLVAPQAAARPFEALERAGMSALKRGDLEGYGKFAQQAASMKTLYATTAFSRAYQSGDPDAVAGVARDVFGANASAKANDDGTITATFGPRSQTFKSYEAFGAAVQGMMEPKNLMTAILDSDKRRAEIELKDAERDSHLANAQNKREASRWVAPLAEAEIRQRDRANRPDVAPLAMERQFGFMTRPVEKGGLGMSTAEARTALVKGEAGGRSREQAITDVATRLATAYNASLAGMSNPRDIESFLGEAVTLVDGAASHAGAARVGSGPTKPAASPSAAPGAPRPGPRPENLPPQAGKSYSTLWK